MNLFAHSRLEEPGQHKYVTLIEFALRNSEFSVNDACAEAGISEKEFRFIAGSIFSLNMLQADAGLDPARRLEWIVQPNAYFSYLQWLGFRHAVEHARRAYWLSALAAIVAVVSAFIALRSGCT